ncbi:hypothetical protein BO99DRAFT_118013 [Aspergillus violaceofuscus CBS 115571]|uniref:Uncharacterized protein n=1 Tax=Aspergillus violaceofuscus (strain CBS 115571) TaxID=1450538 RepID=A0A2V5HCG6_ASPV1|nr:hypothetical protein BO99DRAFT_118013 [Aspergillus violaceofuscus CBS 115571]
MVIGMLQPCISGYDSPPPVLMLRTRFPDASNVGGTLKFSLVARVPFSTPRAPTRPDLHCMYSTAPHRTATQRILSTTITTNRLILGTMSEFGSQHRQIAPGPSPSKSEKPPSRESSPDRTFPTPSDGSKKRVSMACLACKKSKRKASPPPARATASVCCVG